jgi:hypothetical protein
MTKQERQEYDRIYRQTHKEERRAYRSKYHLTHKERARECWLQWNYGIGVAEYNAIYDQQQGRCKFCGKEKKLVVDHCHDSGGVRWLLCSQCNQMLGLAYDNPTTLRNAARCLETIGIREGKKLRPRILRNEKPGN